MKKKTEKDQNGLLCKMWDCENNEEWMFSTYQPAFSHHIPATQRPTKISSCSKRKQIMLKYYVTWVLVKINMANTHPNVW